MRTGARARLVIAAVLGAGILAASGGHMSGGYMSTATKVIVAEASEPQQVGSSHADVVAATVVARTESAIRDDTKRPPIRFGSLLALGASAYALTIALCRRDDAVDWALPLTSAARRVRPPRAPPRRLS